MKKSFRWGLSAALALTVVVTGCSSNKPASNPKSTNSAVDSKAANTTPKAGGTLSVEMNADPPKLDPSLSSALVDRQVFQSIYDKLVDIDATGKIVPMLAEQWTVSDDHKVYTLKLRQGVKFHDGTDFNAEAVKFNIERGMDKNSVRRSELAEVEKVSVSDPYTVVIQLSKPFAPFLSVLTDRAGMIVSPEAVKKYGEDFVNHPVGTGPFIFKDRVKGTSLTVEKNPNYWQKGLPYLDKVVYKIFTDSNVALTNQKSGQVDITTNFPYKEIENMKNDTNIKVINLAGQGFQGIHLNTSKAPFDNKELRQAVDLMIDREALIKVALSGAGTPAHSPFAPSHFSYGDSDKYEKPNLAKAKELLKKAGKPDGFSFSLKIGTTPTNQQVGEMVQNMLKPAGITVTLDKVEFGTMLDQAKKGNHESTQLGWSGRPDPDQNIYDFAFTGASNNYSQYSNPEVDKLLKEGRGEGTEAKRKAIYDDLMKKLNDDDEYVYLWHSNNVFGISKGVQGFTYIPDGLIRTATISK
ncbi:peptide/nickel transport system substrate-binding protein [Paenibacillus sp. yr247]|uniref:ABC transporter substrate-binding protein n=1 Tax=Paenibacillus sp. yr247 TaxID=1761880 RepID=UPI0008814589|nr:ABC transporter substrate-binding protein [Paenibacillus sp. yr247]SDN94858.1 peptide/nickel transport system substrate-binding protein [Paenibacillus sp. yr247]